MQINRKKEIIKITVEIQERGDICICVADSLCCIAETDATLKSNCTPVKNKKIKIKMHQKINKMKQRLEPKERKKLKMDLPFFQKNKIHKHLARIIKKKETRYK